MAYGFNDDKSKVEVLGREEVGFMGKLIRLKSDPVRVYKGGAGRKEWVLQGNRLEDYIILAVNVGGMQTSAGEGLYKLHSADMVQVEDQQGLQNITCGRCTPNASLYRSSGGVLRLTADFQYIDYFDASQNPPSYVDITFEVLLMDVSGLQSNE